jgi:hypothetical protein
MHILLQHPDGAEVRRTAQASGLELRRLNSYRQHAAKGDGLLLRFGGLGLPAIRVGVERLVAAAMPPRGAAGSIKR